MWLVFDLWLCDFAVHVKNSGCSMGLILKPHDNLKPGVILLSTKLALFLENDEP